MNNIRISKGVARWTDGFGFKFSKWHLFKMWLVRIVMRLRSLIQNKTFEEIDAIMLTIPKEWRDNWCGGEKGSCACLGCVQIGNRLIMIKRFTGEEFRGDPEYIDESKIPKEIYNQYKITKYEWELWKKKKQ